MRQRVDDAALAVGPRRLRPCPAVPSPHLHLHLHLTHPAAQPALHLTARPAGRHWPRPPQGVNELIAFVGAKQAGRTGAGSGTPDIRLGRRQPTQERRRTAARTAGRGTGRYRGAHRGVVAGTREIEPRLTLLWDPQPLLHFGDARSSIMETPASRRSAGLWAPLVRATVQSSRQHRHGRHLDGPGQQRNRRADRVASHQRSGHRLAGHLPGAFLFLWMVAIASTYWLIKYRDQKASS